MFHTKFKKINDKFAIGKPIEAGYSSIINTPMVFFVSLTGTGATATLNEINERYHELCVLPSRKLITDEITIPWGLEKQNKPIVKIENRKIRYELNKFFRKYHEGGITEIIEQLSVREPFESEYCIFDNLRHVKEIMYAKRIFKNLKFVLFKAKNIDRVKRIANSNYTFSNIGSSGVYKEITDMPGWKNIFVASELAEIKSLIEKGELTLEGVNKAMQIIIKENEEYDHHKLAMKLYDVAHDTTLLLDSSSQNPVERAEEVYKWLKQNT